MARNETAVRTTASCDYYSGLCGCGTVHREDCGIPAVQRGVGFPGARAQVAQNQELQLLLEAVRGGPTRIKPQLERRMVPSINNKEGHHPLRLPTSLPS